MAGMTLGATDGIDGTTFCVWSHGADCVWLCLFDDADRETQRIRMTREGDVHRAAVPGIAPGQRYGFRADGPHDPATGLWFDPGKLLVDPYAIRLDRPFCHDAALAAHREFGGDTAALVPKAIVEAPAPEAPRARPRFAPAGLIYELNVRGFTMLHPDVPECERGTLRALAHPAIIAHLKRLGVAAVELMPVAAWIDERHLAALGLRNAWGYNPITFMALDPRLAPGGIADLRAVADAFHAAGIGLILDVVYNHSGESDALGPTLSLRGLDAQAYFRHAAGHPGLLVNDTGTGNTIRCQHPAARALILDAMRHFVRAAGVDGFRFDLATVLGRDVAGFHPDAPLLAEMRADPLLGDRVLIAEPWDVGPGGYQLGRFPPPFLEWNDRYRDDVRGFWRGDGSLGALATRMCGSADIFGASGPATRSVSFVAAHDGFTLADLTAYAERHNEANGEANRDGSRANVSWNNGVEGATDDPAIDAARRRDRKALLSTLFATRGAIMLTAGDEHGRSQRGSNNAYAQDNDTTWIDWASRDTDLEDHVADLAALRRRWPALADPSWLSGEAVEWRGSDGAQGWEPGARLMVFVLRDGERRLAVAVNGSDAPIAVTLPEQPARQWVRTIGSDGLTIAARSIGFFEDRPYEGHGNRSC